MSDAPTVFPAATAVPASRGLRWCVDGLRLWRRAPFKLFFVYLAVSIVELVIENIPWVGSWTLHILVAGMMLYGLLLGLDDLAHGKPLRWSCLVACFRRGWFARSVALVSLCGLVVFGSIQLAVWLAYGQPGIDLMWLGQRAANKALMTPQLQQIASVAGVVPGVLLMLAPCFMLFEGHSPWHAFTRSARIAWRYAAPFSVFALVNIVLVYALSSTRWMIPLSLLFIPPWIIACNYAIWSDLRGAAPESITNR